MDFEKKSIQNLLSANIVERSKYGNPRPKARTHYGINKQQMIKVKVVQVL